ncbi:MAG: hypothetical protein GDA52_10520 [Rhodobacteraceae bacterium]|nr:hypothetical protein [Paracoccaceae bacterium]
MSAYSERAQPYMDALAKAIFQDQSVRDWLITGTAKGKAFRGARSLHKEQENLRKPTKQPFYCNYWCGRDTRCTCRVEGARGLETDMMVFLEAPDQRRLGISIEMKAPGDQLSPGQAECYPLRAACWCEGRTGYYAVIPHKVWMTVLLCPDADLTAADVTHFDKAIGHSEAGQIILGWPA